MIERAVAAGLPFAWFTADEAYGDNGPLRTWLEETGVAYVLAVSAAASRPPPGGPGTGGGPTPAGSARAGADGMWTTLRPANRHP